MGRTSAPGGTSSQSTSRVSRKRNAAPRASSGSFSHSGADKRPRLRIAREQRAALGDVVGMIRLEAPGVEADGDVVDQRIGAGEIEIDQPRELVAEEKNVVGKQIGVDDALRQTVRPLAFEQIELGGQHGLQIALHRIARARRTPHRAAASRRPRARSRAAW